MAIFRNVKADTELTGWRSQVAGGSFHRNLFVPKLNWTGPSLLPVHQCTFPWREGPNFIPKPSSSALCSPEWILPLKSDSGHGVRATCAGPLSARLEACCYLRHPQNQFHKRVRPNNRQNLVWTVVLWIHVNQHQMLTSPTHNTVGDAHKVIFWRKRWDQTNAPQGASSLAHWWSMSTQGSVVGKWGSGSKVLSEYFLRSHQQMALFVTENTGFSRSRERVVQGSFW